MPKVLIVDDEPIVRIGLKSMIDWKILNLELVGEASNGQEALELCEQIDPDIVITDIKMPVMDGITMMKNAVAKGLRAKYIILSCHDEFMLVREALRCGAYDYLIKLEIQPDALQATLKAVAGCIAEEKSEQMRDFQDKLRVTVNNEGAKSDFFRQLLNGMAISEQRTNEKLLEFWPGASAESVVNCAVIRISDIADSEDFPATKDIPILNVYIKNIASEIAGDFYDSYVLHFSAAIQVLILRSDEPEQKKDKLLQMCDRILTMLFTYANFKASMGVGCWCKGFHNLKAPFDQAMEMVDIAFFNASTAIVYNGETPEEQSQLLDVNHLFQSLEEAAKFCNTTKANSAIEKLCDTLKSGGISKGQACDICYQTAIILGDSLRGAKENGSVYSVIAKLDTIEKMLAWLGNVKQEIATGFAPHDPTLQTILKAKEYIKEHIHQDVTLLDIANHLNLNSSYVSQLFKKSTGENFVGYVTRLKVECGMEMLMNSPLKVYEVAQQIGFSNAYYFTKVFKKVTGLAPTEFVEKANRS